MINNRLVLNSDKTHLLVLTSAHRHRKNGNFGISLDTGNETVLPQDCEELLGATLSNNFLWNNHIRDGEKAVIKSLNTKNNALSKISSVADFKTRKMIAEGLIMSTVSYIIQVYGSCSGYLVSALQVQQNRAARYTTKLPFLTPTKVILAQCNWLSIKQLIVYHSLILLHKVMLHRKPEYIFSRLKFVDRESRTSDCLMLVENHRFKTVTASKSYLPRTIRDWNSLPLYIRTIESPVIFKNEVKLFVKDNIPIK